MKSALNLISQPQEYFHELLVSTLDRKSIRRTPEIEIYLVGILSRFLVTENLFGRNEDGQMRDEPLALMLKEALEEPSPEHQRLLFRQMGDVSLYTAGFFSESLSRRSVDLGYYVQMGGAAYSSVAERVDERASRALYSDLAERFGNYVDAFMEMSASATAERGLTEAELLKTYDLYLRTHSPRAERTLRAAGIVPQVLSAGRKGIKPPRQ